MRAARFLGYPLQVRQEAGTVNHIIEDGYAHLMYRLDPARTVVTVHDLIPLLTWKGRIPGRTYAHRPRLYELSLRAVRKAAHVISISESTRRDLIDDCGCREDQVSVVYYGLGSSFRAESPETRASVRAGFGFPDRETHLVLITGQLYYKNHRTSLKVVERLQERCEKPVVLVRLGTDYPEWDEHLGSVSLKTDPIQVKGLSHDRMVDLYNSVDCLLFPSWYEGFGRPPLESMACGTPVVASTTPALLEVVGDAALTAAADDVEALAVAVQRVLEDNELRQTLVSKGLENASRFTWKRNAEETLKIYEKIINQEAENG